MTDKASELFEDVVTDGNGTTCHRCEFCGRISFTDMDEDAASLRAKAAAEPENYTLNNYDALGFGILDGKNYVYGCCPANILKYELFIWNHRRLIMKYLKRRSAAELAAAKNDANLCE